MNFASDGSDVIIFARFQITVDLSGRIYMRGEYFRNQNHGITLFHGYLVYRDEWFISSETTVESLRTARSSAGLVRVRSSSKSLRYRSLLDPRTNIEGSIDTANVLSKCPSHGGNFAVKITAGFSKREIGRCSGLIYLFIHFSYVLFIFYELWNVLLKKYAVSSEIYYVFLSKPYILLTVSSEDSKIVKNLYEREHCNVWLKKLLN